MRSTARSTSEALDRPDASSAASVAGPLRLVFDTAAFRRRMGTRAGEERDSRLTNR